MFLFNIPTHWPLGQEPPKALLFRVYAALALNSTLFYSEEQKHFRVIENLGPMVIQDMQDVQEALGSYRSSAEL